MTKYNYNACPVEDPGEPSASTAINRESSPPPARSVESPASGSINPSIHQSITTPSASPTPSVPQPSTLNPQPFFPRLPGETPRAFGAFITFFQLGHARSLQAVADKLGESLGTVKNWSSKFDWSGRIQAFNSGLLQQQAQAQAALQRQQAADWAARLDRFREQEWDAAQKLLARRPVLPRNLRRGGPAKMTLAQVSRALKISSAIGRSALAGAEPPRILRPRPRPRSSSSSSTPSTAFYGSSAPHPRIRPSP